MRKEALFLCFSALLTLPLMSQTDKFGSYEEILEWIDNPTQDHVMVVAHRGDWRHAPENSIQAVLNCIEMGVEIVEIDVRMTKDSQLVVIHDKTLERTTTGEGLVSETKLSEIRKLKLKNGLGQSTEHRIPTLEEMMLTVKDKPVLLNLDKAWPYMDKAFDILKATKTTRQCIFKGNDSYDVMRLQYGDMLDSIFYMPMVWPRDYNIYKSEEDRIKDPKKYVMDYIENYDPKAFEVIYSNEESEIFETINAMEENKTAVWVNALWGKLCAYHHDDVAVSNPDLHYGWIIHHGANIIQTDRPQFLIKYLESKNLRNPIDHDRISRLIENLEDSENDQVMVVAHRGDWRHAPENSLQAIQNCIDMGVDMVEIDVRMTRDGYLVLMHDKTIDRTTTGAGYVHDWTLDSLRELRLVDGLGVETEHQIPLLEEALLLTKGKILVNLDKSYEIFEECFEVVQKTGTEEQVILKGVKTYAEVEKEFGEYLDEVYFMPIVRLPDPEARAVVYDYIQERVPVAFEFTVPNYDAVIEDYDYIRSAGASVWVNALWPHHNMGHDDEKAVLDLSVYDWFIENDVDIIQTDRPALLLSYLRARGLHD